MIDLKRAELGFTLLELIVAMAIFAMLAVAGWQVFDNINRSKERAQLQVDTITQLQYGYQQLQRDMTQVVAYQLVENTSSSAIEIQAQSQDSQNPMPKTAFSLKDNQLSFIRHANPDPRYQQNALLQKVVYRYSEGKLIRELYNSITVNNNEQPIASVILSGLSGAELLVLLPEPSREFPKAETAIDSSARPHSNLQNMAVTTTSEPQMLPKGVKVNFNVKLGNSETPITWVYALTKAPPTVHVKTSEDSKVDPKNEPSKKTEDETDSVSKP